MSKVCEITGKSYCNGNRVSHSKRRTKHRQYANLQWKKFWIPEKSKWVRLRVSTTAIKTITKYGVMGAIKRYGVDPKVLEKR